LVVTSPPYNCGIEYDIYNDNLSKEGYFAWCRKWLSEIYRTLKSDGRICLNVPNEANFHERGGRIFMASEFWSIMKEIGFNFFGVVDLAEESPHRPKNTSWGSYMSPSSPYIYNPKECLILAYKIDKAKKNKGKCDWDYSEIEIIKKDGKKRLRKEYNEIDKNLFMELVFGCWKYKSDTKSITKASFSLDIPMKAIKILTYKGELVLDCFSGSGTTALAAKILERNYIGFELSNNYTDISRQRLEDYQKNKTL
jgi:site-specific DNA-methyltransferase (adenine-specific)